MNRKTSYLSQLLLFALIALSLSSCFSPNVQNQNNPTTSVGTPRDQTLIVQNFDGKTDNADIMNPLMGNYAIWRGFRELGWGYLWEMNTATGQSYPELADGMPQVLNPQHTLFRVNLKHGIYWSDGVEFTADDVIYTLDTYFKDKSKLTYFGVPVITSYVKSYKQLDRYSFEVETVNPAYDFVTTMGVYTWGSAFNIVPKHVFEKQADIAAFKTPIRSHWDPTPSSRSIPTATGSSGRDGPTGSARHGDGWASRNQSISSTKISARRRRAPWPSSRTSTTLTPS